MLINQIIKYTNTDDPDYENLQKASKSIKEINVKNNEFMGRHAKQKRKLELNAIVHEHITLALSHRNLLNEYHDLLVTNIDSKTTKSWMLALFTDLALVLKKSSKNGELTYFKHIEYDPLSFAIPMGK